MSTGFPMATVRLAADRLDPRQVNRILLSRGGIVDVKSKPGVWMATTDGYESFVAQDHLTKLLGIVTGHLNELREAVPGVRIAFSLLVFDPDFSFAKITASVISAITEIGSLSVEVPLIGQEFFFTDHEAQVYAA